jgi:hypothetical protein
MYIFYDGTHSSTHLRMKTILLALEYHHTVEFTAGFHGRYTVYRATITFACFNMKKTITVLFNLTHIIENMLMNLSRSLNTCMLSLKANLDENILYCNATSYMYIYTWLFGRSPFCYRGNTDLFI